MLAIEEHPSSIGIELVWQAGLPTCCKLTAEWDIEAVLSGVSSRSVLRAALDSPNPHQQSLIMSHAVPMPIVLRTRPYGKHLSRAMAPGVSSGRGATLTASDLCGVR